MAIDSTIAIAFCLPPEQLGEEDKSLMEMSINGTAASATSFMSFIAVNEVAELVEEAAMKVIQTISTKDMAESSFKERTNKLVPASGEFFVIAKA